MTAATSIASLSRKGTRRSASTLSISSQGLRRASEGAIWRNRFEALSLKTPSRRPSAPSRPWGKDRPMRSISSANSSATAVHGFLIDRRHAGQSGPPVRSVCFQTGDDRAGTAPCDNRRRTTTAAFSFGLRFTSAADGKSSPGIGGKVGKSIISVPMASATLTFTLCSRL